MINKKITELVEELFNSTIYSKNIEISKEKVVQILNTKYVQLLESDKSEIEALGEIMLNYGTLKKAGKVAGFNEEEIAEWMKQEDSISSKDFSKWFRRVRWRIYILSLSVALVLISCVNVFVYSSLMNIVAAFVYAIPGIICGYLLYKDKKKYSYEQDIYSQDTRIILDKLFDRYNKRLLNTIYFLIAGVFFEIYIYFVSTLKGGMTSSEALMSMSTENMSYALIILILLKNIFCKYWLTKQYDKKQNEEYKKYVLISIGASILYWIIAVTTVILLRNVIDNIFNVILFAAMIYFVIILTSNLTIRKKIVFHNLSLNLKRIIVVGLCVISVLSYHIMQMDVFLLQPYISTVKAMQKEDNIIEYDDETGIYTITTKKSDFKVLQLTDIHLGGSAVSVIKDYKALKACETLITRTQPDLVVVTGDLVFPLGVMSFSLNNTAPIIEFANFMRNINVPWAFLYGNHDTELLANGSISEVKNTFESLSFKTSGNLLYPYVQPDITGRNNQLIKIRNADGSLNQALFLMDSNDYIGGVNEYDYIHDDEVAWYKKQVETMNAEEEKLVSSLLFFHMPLQEYRTAYELYEDNNDQVKYFFGANNEKMIDKICCSKYPSKIFDTAKELGSTKAMFCGHDHYNNLSVEYEGIRLTYGMSIDYLAMPGIDKDTEQRGATLITLHKDSSYDIQQIPLDK